MKVRKADCPHTSIGLTYTSKEDYHGLVKVAKEFVKKGYKVNIRPPGALYAAFVVKDLPEYERKTLQSIGYDIMLVSDRVVSILYTEQVKL